MEIYEFIEYLKSEYYPGVIKVEKLEKKNPIYKDFSFNNSKIDNWITKNNIRFYLHQSDAWEALFNENKNILVVTPTASGKSYIYMLAALKMYEEDNNSTFLFIYPTRALLSDQYYKLNKLSREIGIDIKIGRFYGDYKSKGSIILTTPDTLHLNILKNHEFWQRFFKNLKLLVVDELHIYYGLLGSNFALTLRRLRHILENIYKNKNYKIIGTSATVKDPLLHAKRLFGQDLEFKVISKSGAPQSERILVFINPSEYENVQNNKNRDNIRKLIIDLIYDELTLLKDSKILTFVETRKFAEKIFLYISQYFEEISKMVYVYKGTFTKETRKEIERKFKEGVLRCLIATNALELGIDIGDLNIVNNIGIPGDGISSLLQRFGRAGRDPNKIALNILIFKKNVLDQYYAKNIDELLEKIKLKDVEQPIVTLNNKRLLKEHLLYLTYEVSKIKKGIRENQLKETEKRIMEELVKENKVQKISTIFGETIYYVPAGMAPDYIKLRNIEEEYTLIDSETNKTIETLDKRSVYSEALPGFIYISHGKIYRIEKIDEIGNKIYARRENTLLSTSPISEEEVEILEIYDNKKLYDTEVFYGKIKLRKIIHGYIEKYYSPEEETWKYAGEPQFYEEPYIYEFKTEAVWITFPEEYQDIANIYYKSFFDKLEESIEKYNLNKKEIYNVVDELYDNIDYYKLYTFKLGKIKEYVENIILERLTFLNLSPPIKNELAKIIRKIIESKYALESGLHAIEHASILLTPTIVLIDQRELGGRSFKLHSQTNKPTIFIYEAIPEGIGYSSVIYENFERLLKRVYTHLLLCKCFEGCPKCVYSPKCGNANEFLDKIAAKLILEKLFSKDNFSGKNQ